MSAKNPTVQILAALVVLLCACSAPTAARQPSPEPRVLAVQTVTPDQIILAAAIFGPLSGRVNQDGTACFSLGDFAAVIWPQGSFAEANPLTVYDSSGNRIARIGDYVELSGGQNFPRGTVVIKGCSGVTFTAMGLFVRVVPAQRGQRMAERERFELSMGQ